MKKPLWKPLLTLTLAGTPLIASGDTRIERLACSGQDFTITFNEPEILYGTNDYYVYILSIGLNGERLGVSVGARGLILANSFDVKLKTNATGTGGPADGNLGILRGRKIDGKWVITHQRSERDPEVKMKCK